jgi:hypothetical protein
MQLVAYGAQDVYLSGTPQITFWKVVYRRHTNFSIETIEQSIDAARPGGKYTVTVTRNGDLASNACLKVKLAALTPASWAGPTPDKIAWVRRLGHAMVTQVKVEIGGSTIDTHVGTWLDLWYELTHKTDQERGYRAMIGDVPELTELRAPARGINAYTVYIPFQFWFCRNTGLALPLIALQYHEVRFHIEMESIQKLIVWQGSTTPTMTAYTYQTAAVMIDYVYLDSEERRKFAQVGHEYLIEEVQHNGGETLSGSVTSAGASINQKFRLNFNHPCKELVWALKCGAFSGEALTNSFSGGKTFLGYTHDDDNWDEVLDRVAKGLVEGCVQGMLGSDTAVVPYATAVSFVDDSPADITRVAREGKFNITAVLNATVSEPLKVNVRTSTASGTRLLGTSDMDLFSYITEADVHVICAGAASTVLSYVTCTRVVHTLTMELLSQPASTWTVDNRIASSDTRTHANSQAVVHVVQPHNYGLNLDGSGNFVSLAKIELNGHDRFDWQEGSYFNYVQPRAHTRTPADGVNVYCFGLHPENHQPSGSANLSRIDTTILNLTMKDSKRPTGSVLLDWVSDSKLHIFALNYNVLRVMSGMAGKAYSN